MPGTASLPLLPIHACDACAQPREEAQLVTVRRPFRAMPGAERILRFCRESRFCRDLGLALADG